ncbi:MAG: hypothetical protein ABI972_26495 [Acidobacteriota bacterium]
MIVVVGGHSRNIGKTTVAASIIAATREAGWTAVKVTQHGHGVCTHACSCAEHEDPVAIDEEAAPNGTDSGRFLAAGAERAFWVRTAQGELAQAMPHIRELIASSPNVLFESNSLLQFLKPDLYLVVVDFSVEDMKDSAQHFIDRADAFVKTGGDTAKWEGVSGRWFAAKPVLEPQSPDLFALVRERLAKGTA